MKSCLLNAAHVGGERILSSSISSQGDPCTGLNLVGSMIDSFRVSFFVLPAKSGSVGLLKSPLMPVFFITFLLFLEVSIVFSLSFNTGIRNLLD